MSAPLAQISRSVLRSVLAQETAEGVGAVVRRSIGTAALRNFTPFLMLDNFRVGEGAGFPDHPHRGMSTLTYLIEGSFQHEDFVGHHGHLNPGDVQFMIAGRGILHAEMPQHTIGGKHPMGLQLWIDLPKEHKMVEPSYQELKADEIPTANPSDTVSIKVVCGTAQGSPSQGLVHSPVKPLGGCWFLDVTTTSPSSSLFQSIPTGWNAFIYTLSGSISINSSPLIPPFHTSVLSSSPTESGINITTSVPSRFFIIAGEPLDQEIVQHGPFVMDTRQGIMDAFEDYRGEKNGFEGAGGWRSEIGKRMA